MWIMIKMDEVEDLDEWDSEDFPDEEPWAGNSESTSRNRSYRGPANYSWPLEKVHGTKNSQNWWKQYTHEQ